MSYSEAKALRDKIVSASRAAAAALASYPKSAMGLTPDDVKESAQWKADKLAFELAFADECRINAFMVRNFKAEMRAERIAKRVTA